MANPIAATGRAPVRPTSRPAACAPTPVATATGRNSRPVSNALRANTCCSSSELRKNPEISSADATNMVMMPAAIGR
jgi:hypothetical protein